jgi:hypothetical protein
MNDILQLKADLLTELPGLSANLDEPMDPQGKWWIDLKYQGHCVTVEWMPSIGFGVSAPTPETVVGYGEGPEEALHSLAETRDRVLYLLKYKTYTQPPLHVLLREKQAQEESKKRKQDPLRSKRNEIRERSIAKAA